MAASFLYPVGQVPIAQPFGGNGGHPGIDFSVPVGTPVHAAADGTVTVLGNNGDAGNQLILDHAESYQTVYDHLSEFRVKVGQSVKVGAVIGLSGGAAGAPGAGNSTGPHLHFEIRLNGSVINPAPLLSGTSNISDTGKKTGGSGGGDDTLGAIGDFFDVLSKGSTWIRIGQIAGGLGILWIAYIIVTKDLSTTAQVRNALKKPLGR